MGLIRKMVEVKKIVEVEFFVCDSCSLDVEIDASGSAPLEWCSIKYFDSIKSRRDIILVCDKCAEAFTVSEIIERVKEQDNG